MNNKLLFNFLHTTIYIYAYIQRQFGFDGVLIINNII